MAQAQDIKRPSQEEVRSLFLHAIAVPHEDSSESIAATLSDATRVSFELGRWIPGGDDEVLVTVTALMTHRTRGLYRRAFAIMNIRTHELVSPVYDYVYDLVGQVIYHGNDQDYLLYVGASVGQGWRSDASLVFMFSEGKIVARSPLGDLSPDDYAIIIHEQKVLVLEHLKDSLNPMDREYRALYELRWSDEKKDLVREELKDKFKVGQLRP
jgi:hypothetical protein